MSPIPGSAVLMCNRGDKHMICAHAIENRERKAIQNEASFATPALWICERRLRDSFDRVIDLESERLRRNFTSFGVPLPCFVEFIARFTMESNQHHRPRNNLERTSSHGTVSASPLSISRHRRSASSAHSSCTSGSAGGSRLSMSSPANVARSFSGNSNASRNIVFKSRDMVRLYVHNTSATTRASSTGSVGFVT